MQLSLSITAPLAPQRTYSVWAFSVALFDMFSLSRAASCLIGLSTALCQVLHGRHDFEKIYGLEPDSLNAVRKVR